MNLGILGFDGDYGGMAQSCREFVTTKVVLEFRLQIFETFYEIRYDAVLLIVIFIYNA